LEKKFSEQKVTEEELLKVKKLESIAALSGGMAHDYNNLLTSIMGNTSLAPGNEIIPELFEMFQPAPSTGCQDRFN
jgi:hypothetical protein